jgi:hypothetical protein
MGGHSAAGDDGAGRPVKDPFEIFRDGSTIDAAMNEAMRRVRILHKRMGVSLVGCVDGQIVRIPPEEIAIDDPATSPAQAQGKKRPRGCRGLCRESSILLVRVTPSAG